MPTEAHNKEVWGLKVVSTWFVKTSKFHSMLSTSMPYSFNDKFDIMPGLQHSDMCFNLNQVILLKKSGEYIIPAGTPLSCIIPFKRQEYNFKLSNRTESHIKREKFDKLFATINFALGYKKHIKSKLKCPFDI